jgi:hypothetical protein
MNRPWNPSTPIETLWAQIQKAKNYAATDNPITDTTAVLSAVQNLTASGQFNTAFDQWRIKPKAEHTYANLMVHFNHANDNRLRSKTTADAGYSAVQPTNTLPTENKENNAGSLIRYHYCWTHGVNKTHRGMHCQYPKEEHIKDATASNIKGGSVFLYQPPNKRNNQRGGRGNGGGQRTTQ